MHKEQHIGHNFNNKYLDANGTYRMPFLTTKLSKGFKGNTEIKKMVLSEDTTVLDKYAFAGCKNLTVIEQINNLEIIPAGAFSNTGIRHFSAPTNLKSIEARAFKDSKDLEFFRFNRGLKEIGMEALSGTKIRILNIVSSLSEITKDWTSNLAYLTRVTIESGVKKILDFAFSDTPLVLISIPKSIIEIAPNAFFNCKFLRFIIAEDDDVLRVQNMLPKSLKSKVIKKHIFSEYQRLHLSHFSQCWKIPIEIVKYISEYDKDFIFNSMVAKKFAGIKRIP